jgi:hypothetical protein
MSDFWDLVEDIIDGIEDVLGSSDDSDEADD